MSAPIVIRDVLAGPHVSTLLRDGGNVLVVAEPLQFVPLAQVVGYCPRCGALEPCSRIACGRLPRSVG